MYDNRTLQTDSDHDAIDDAMDMDVLAIVDAMDNMKIIPKDLEEKDNKLNHNKTTPQTSTREKKVRPTPKNKINKLMKRKVIKRNITTTSKKHRSSIYPIEVNALGFPKVGIEVPPSIIDIPQIDLWPQAFLDDPEWHYFVIFLRDQRTSYLSPSLAAKWERKSRFFALNEGVLLYLGKYGRSDLVAPSQRRPRMVVPQAFQRKIISAFHDLPLAGHFGTAKTVGVALRSFGGRTYARTFCST